MSRWGSPLPVREVLDSGPQFSISPTCERFSLSVDDVDVDPFHSMPRQVQRVRAAFDQVVGQVTTSLSNFTTFTISFKERLTGPLLGSTSPPWVPYEIFKKVLGLTLLLYLRHAITSPTAHLQPTIPIVA